MATGIMLKNFGEIWSVVSEICERTNRQIDIHHNTSHLHLGAKK